MKRTLLVVCVLFVFAASGPCAPPSPPGLNLQTLLQEIRSAVRPDEAMDFVRRLYATDRWFTFPKFAETTAYLEKAIQAIGLEQVERLSAPADGVSQFGYWTEPLAWDVKEARLEIIDPPLPAAQRLLADYTKVPCSLCMWSGSTPPEGVTAEVVELKGMKPEAIAQLDLRGKLVMTADVPSGIKWALAKAGALGAINTYTENPDLPEGRQWINAWGDNGWAFTKSSTPLICFSLPPRGAALVRKLLAEKGAVRVKATVSSRYYSGEYPYVTAVIPGATPEEVLTLGHNAEQGAEDNATGVSAILESAATLRRLIASGKLAPPRRSVRILIMPELYASMHYIATHPERMRRTLAALTVDTPAASYDLAGTEYTFFTNPQVSSSYVDAFILKVAEDYFPTIDLGSQDVYIPKFGRPWHWRAYTTGSDGYLGDPMIGVPDVELFGGAGVETHHNSEDIPSRVDSRSLRDVSVVDAAFLYYLANAGRDDAPWLAGLSESHAYDLILRSMAADLDRIAAARTAPELGRLLFETKEKVSYLVGRGTQAIHSVERLLPEADREALQTSLDPMAARLAQFGDAQALRAEAAARARAEALGITSPIEPLQAPDPRQAEASTIVVKRVRFGTITLDDINPAERQGYPDAGWDTRLIAALYWCDGHRTLAEAIHLTQMELGPNDFDYVGYFRFLRKRGYVEFVKGD